MPRTPTLFLNKEEYQKLEKTAKEKGYQSVYAYMKDLLIKELRKPLIRNYPA